MKHQAYFNQIFSLLFTVIVSNTFAQSSHPVDRVLSTSETGSPNNIYNVAQKTVQFKPGYSFKPTNDLIMHAYIAPHTEYVSPISQTEIDN